jgi:ADP-ribose pyrophosphatase
MKLWQVLRSKELLDRRPWLQVIEQDVQLANGHVIEGYLLAQTREYAVTLALTDDGHVPLVQQYKHGAGRLCYDLPAGYLDANEEPLAAAQRELLEETGYVSDDWQHLGSVVLDTNRSDARAHMFLARGANKVSTPRLDDTEDLITLSLTPAQLLAMVRSGEMDGIASVTCLLLALDALNPTQPLQKGAA